MHTLELENGFLLVFMYKFQILCIELKTNIIQDGKFNLLLTLHLQIFSFSLVLHMFESLMLYYVEP